MASFLIFCLVLTSLIFLLHFNLFIEGDGRFGYPEAGPYDAIHVGAASPGLFIVSIFKFFSIFVGFFLIYSFMVSFRFSCGISEAAETRREACVSSGRLSFPGDWSFLFF